MSHSKIFSGNRALGYVSNHIPVVTRYIQRRKENLIVTCVGKAFHTYGCSHFTLLSVSGVHDGEITCMTADAYHIYTASDNKIYAWRRGSELKHTYKGHECPIHILHPFGPHLISIDEDSNLKLWDIRSEENVLELNFANSIFQITTIVHPSTYINKILLGSEQGQLQIWNLKSAKMIYTFKGWSSPVSVLEQAPAVDVIAIGLANGKIVLHNIKYDESIVEFIQDWGLVTSIAFRSDGHPIMATGSLAGHVVFWNLEQRKVDCQLLNAHFGAVTGLNSLPNEPLIVTSSPDNSLKLWIFDLADGGARLLRIREGHAEPPTFIRFHGSNGHNILSAGGDSSLRIFSTITETYNKSLGRASFNRKASKKKSRAVEDPLIMPPITLFTSESTREKDWDNVAALHLGLGVVTTWSYDKIKMGELKLLPDRFKHNPSATATSLCITHCGNFVIIGYSTGHVDRFNIQSGIYRATYGGENGGHTAPVSGVAVDTLNQFVITAGRDATIKFWSFKQTKDSSPRTVIEVKEPVEWLRTHAETSLIALALEDLSIILIDLDTRRLVRHFNGHTSRITDATFSPDARWLITASMDCTIRTWDIPSAQLIDIFSVEEACTSLHFSPTGEYLATSHVCNLGIYLWSNRTLYSHVSLTSIPSDLSGPVLALPGSAPEPNQLSVDSEDRDGGENVEFVSPEQIHSKLITMSSLANSRWQNLLNIDIVKKRNKPKEAPKAPPAAPFFLPTIPSLEVQFDLGEATDKDQASKLLTPTNFDSLTVFGKLLQLSSETDDFSEVIERFKSLGPSAIDFEIQSLALHSGGSIVIMLQFLKMIRSMMKSKKDFELAQAYLGAFLKSHGETIAADQQLREYLPKVQKAQLASWTTLRDNLFYNLSVVQHLKRV
ncbi:WD repeat-containing protein 36 [Neodiprion lecontei]|uniref:WD repeat-containing protein 36 n=1 Tax=Neodiprion lecontei TaxID=441921 RepID=A0A6J0C7U1_NEOLC|nr:WD repeat-containing protein 36 [Neodiprion lecontei]